MWPHLLCRQVGSLCHCVLLRPVFPASHQPARRALHQCRDAACWPRVLRLEHLLVSSVLKVFRRLGILGHLGDRVAILRLRSFIQDSCEVMLVSFEASRLRP